MVKLNYKNIKNGSALMNYLDHKTEVKYVDGLLAYSQEWQWLINEIENNFQINKIGSWEQYLIESQHIKGIFKYFVKILEICDKEWKLSKKILKKYGKLQNFILGLQMLIIVQRKFFPTKVNFSFYAFGLQN